MKLSLRLIQYVTYSLQRGLVHVVHLVTTTTTTACATPTMMCVHYSHRCIYDTRKIQSCSACHRLLNASVLNVEVMLNVV
jgi:hypothetical protein